MNTETKMTEGDKTASQSRMIDELTAPGCGACADGCKGRGSCRVRDESPPSAPAGVEGPLSVFSAGEWRYSETGQTFSAKELDEAAFVVYRDHLAQQSAAVGEEIMVNAAHDVFTLPLQPSRLTGGPRFVVHVPGPEQPAAVDDLNAWRAAFVAERAMRYREGGMAIEQARIHAETDAARMAVLAAGQQQGGA